MLCERVPVRRELTQSSSETKCCYHRESHGVLNDDFKQDFFESTSEQLKQPINDKLFAKPSAVTII